jgi:hypothetical protein
MIRLIDNNISGLGNPSLSDTLPLTMLWGIVSQPLSSLLAGRVIDTVKTEHTYLDLPRMIPARLIIRTSRSTALIRARED